MINLRNYLTITYALISRLPTLLFAMDPVTISVITTNKNKFDEIYACINADPNHNYSVVQKCIEFTEIQGTPDEIIQSKCMQVLNNGYLLPNEIGLIEDSSLELKALNGMPGPYIKDFLKAMDLGDITNLLSGFSDKSARSICKIALIRNITYEYFTGTLNGFLVQPCSRINESSFGFDPIFQIHHDNPHYEGKVLGELYLSEKNNISARGNAIRGALQSLNDNYMWQI
jgi:inosine triphosphate pyrophosphatase